MENGKDVCPLVCLQFSVQILSKRLADHWKYMIQKPKADLSTMVIAPMPGMVKSVAVKVGDEVSEGQEVLVLEAMKMQNSLLSTKTSKVCFLRPASPISLFSLQWFDTDARRLFC